MKGDGRYAERNVCIRESLYPAFIRGKWIRVAPWLQEDSRRDVLDAQCVRALEVVSRELERDNDDDDDSFSRHANVRRDFLPIQCIRARARTKTASSSRGRFAPCLQIGMRRIMAR